MGGAFSLVLFSSFTAEPMLMNWQFFQHRQGMCLKCTLPVTVQEIIEKGLDQTAKSRGDSSVTLMLYLKKKKNLSSGKSPLGPAGEIKGRE